MYTIVTKIDSTDIELVWLSDKSELTDGVLVCQFEGEISVFEEINSSTHKMYEFEGSLPSDFEPSTYKFESGQLIKK